MTSVLCALHMLRGTRENISLLASISNCAGVMALCFLLLATTVVVSPQTLHSTLLQPAYAQDAAEEDEGEEGTTDTGAGEEEGTTDTGAGEEEGTTDTGAGEEEGTTDTGAGEEEGTTDTGAGEEEGTTDTGAGEEQLDDTVVLTNLQRVVELAGITDPSGLSEIAGASDSDEVAEIAGASDSEALAETPGITSPEAIDAIAGVSNVRELAELVGLSIDDLYKEVLPEQPPTDEEPPTTRPLTAEIISNYTAEEDDDDHVAPETINFTANVSGGTGQSSTVNWNFGDDSEESDEESVVHTFDEAGTYNVTLTATDSNGETASDTLEITVEESSTDEEPPTTTDPLTAEINSNDTEDVDVAPATFSFNATIAGGTEPYTVNWNFGDDSEESDEESVVHTFDEAGTYNVTLTATDSNGETASDTLEITVEESSTDEEPPTTTDPLTAEINSNDTEDVDVAPATFSFNATIAGGTEPYTVNWNFGDDSEESDEESVVHTFDEAGTYNVTLTATDSNGETASDTLEITVEESSEEPVPPVEGGTDKWGIKEIYPTASNGPTWFIREVNDPTTDPLFYYGIYEGTTIKSIGTGVWQVDARSGIKNMG